MFQLSTIRTRTHRYILNLAPDTVFTTHITGCKSGPHYLPFWDSWVEKAKTDDAAGRIVDAYQRRAYEELYDMRKDPFDMDNLADNPEYSQLLGALRTQLAQWCKKQGDTQPLEHLSQ